MVDPALRAQLNDFDATVRRHALEQIELRRGAIRVPLHVNMHCHTFFSYNGYDASPSTVAVQAVEDGWYAAGICDFDVLDGLGEFLDACDLLGLRGTANLETRTFFSEYAAHEINSPGEPGVYYFMGAGFVAPPPPGSAAARQLQAMREGAAARTRDLVDRVNDDLGKHTLDYDADVLPLTPNGNATERHVCMAYYHQGKDDVDFWAEKLGTERRQMAAILADPMAFADLARKKLMKAGGPGYVQPTMETFPLLDDVIAMIRACGAVPMATWLDGTTSGEARIDAQLELLVNKGVAALNIIPDRNWDLKDADEQALKVAKLHECVAAANKLGLPVNVGTELNKHGQKWVDEFDAEPMRAVADTFIRGAEIMVGHGRLLRDADFSYIGPEAAAEFPTRAARNDFFAAVGALPPPPAGVQATLRDSEPRANFARLRDAAAKGEW